MMRQKKMVTMIFKEIYNRLIGDMLILCCVLAILCMGLFTACNPTVEAHTDNVTIDIEVEQVSAGFAHVNFSTTKKAFYLTGIHPVRENINPQKVAKQFMLLALDSAYVEYLYWRNQQLQQLTPFVADFASHSLQYGDAQQFFTLLHPATDYWVYAFVVDANANKPTGKLFITTITTDSVSQMAVNFEYRIKGDWEYVYPKDSMGEIISNIPWVGELVDSMVMREQGWNSPREYFLSRFEDVYSGSYDHILYGIYAHENNVSDNGTPVTKFEIGRTYYKGMAVLDAPLTHPLDTNAYDVYRFTWLGDTTEYYFTPIDCKGGEW